MRTGLLVRVTTELVSRPYVDMTVAVMEAFGVTVERPDESTWVVEPQTYRATTYAIDPNASAASYFFAAAAVVGGRVTLAGLGTPPPQGALDLSSEERRAGKACATTCTSRCAPSQSK